MSEQAQGTVIQSLEQLIDAWMRWFKYDTFEGSPYPSGELPIDAIRKWYVERLSLEVTGPNSFEWTCPGCQARLAVKCNFLHTREPYDYQFWEFCPKCSAATGGD